jgi:hypothetical protein
MPTHDHKTSKTAIARPTQPPSSPAILEGLSLAELTQLEPELWQEVLATIKQAVAEKRTSSLAAMSQKAGATIRRWSNATPSPVAQTQHARHELIKAQMMTLAVEQFISAFTGSHIKPSMSDRITLRWRILRHLEAGSTMTMTAFDAAWMRLKNQAAAAAAVQNAGFWSIPTRELCLGLKSYIKDQSVLEVGCGRGLFVSALREVGVSTIGVDDCSWQPARRVVLPAKAFTTIQNAAEALRENRPKVVLSAWPPPSNSFERMIFATSSVDLYLAIVSSHQFASGNWQDYQAQELSSKGFTCTTNESLNSMLRPLESQQKILIFRRRYKSV